MLLMYWPASTTAQSWKALQLCSLQHKSLCSPECRLWCSRCGGLVLFVHMHVLDTFPAQCSCPHKKAGTDTHVFSPRRRFDLNEPQARMSHVKQQGKNRVVLVKPEGHETHKPLLRFFYVNTWVVYLNLTVERVPFRAEDKCHSNMNAKFFMTLITQISKRAKMLLSDVVMQMVFKSFGDILFVFLL